jgi:hypothetical protein
MKYSVNVKGGLNLTNLFYGPLPLLVVFECNLYYILTFIYVNIPNLDELWNIDFF